jgi:hypothetical protein
MKRILVVMMAVAALAPAQEQRRWVQKVIELKYVHPSKVVNLIGSLNPLTGMRVNFDQEMPMVSLGGPPEAVAEAEALIRQIDVPGLSAVGRRNIELTAYLLVAAPKGAAGDAVPAELDPVVKQLRATFGYADFLLLDTAFLRAREGRSAGTNGNTAALDPGLRSQRTQYEIFYKNAVVSPGEKGSVIRLDDFRLRVLVPTREYTYTDKGDTRTGVDRSEIHIQTNLDIREGQKVVVGKGKIDGSDKALILVMTAKALD